MKFRKILLRVVVVLVSVVLAGAMIRWRMHVSQLRRMPWLDPKNHERILAEARVNGILYVATHTDGSKYYFSSSSKYMFPVSAEELQYEYRALWESNQHESVARVRSGPQWQPFKSGPSRYRTCYRDKEVDLDLTLDPVEPGTTVEELMARERK